MEIIADLHLHSKYSRAVSQNMTLPVMAQFARQKGLNLLTTGDWTHPLWMREIKSQLEEVDQGIYSLKAEDRGVKIEGNEPKFILSVEVSSIYSQGGKTRRIHCLLFSPSIEIAEKFNSALQKRGANLHSDGRPIVGIKPPELLEMLMEIDSRSFLIPCHVWTPWFSLYGSMSGFDSIEECFGDYSKYIYGIETGLSSDPAMNWRISELEHRSILSFSDSHSPIKMGRESTVFELKSLTYDNVKKAIMQPYLTMENRKLKMEKEDRVLKIGNIDHQSSTFKMPSSIFSDLSSNRIIYTIEFYPEEGKYHYTGHRNCKVVYSPDETRKKGIVCPVCSRNLTVGVMEQVEKLAAFEEKFNSNTGKSGVKWISDPARNHPPFAKLVPLNEIIAEVIGSPTTSPKVKIIFDSLTQKFNSEFEVLLKTPAEEIAKSNGQELADAIIRVREGNIYISPGYDGEYGVVKIDGSQKTAEEIDTEQLGLV